MAKKTIRAITLEELQYLSNQSPAVNLKYLTDNADKTKVWLRSKNLRQEEEVLFLRIATAASSHNTDVNLAVDLITLLLSSKYTDSLQKLLINASAGEYTDTQFHVTTEIVRFLSICYSRMPSSMLECLGFLQIIQNQINRDLELFANSDEPERLNNLLLLSEDVKSLIHGILKHGFQIQGRRAVTQKPPDDFRKISIFPQIGDIFNVGKPFLRKVISHGAFDDLEHYLDIQFRLMREDYLSPLRNGIIEYLSMKAQGKIRHHKLQDVRLYKDVISIDKEASMEGMLYTVQLDFQHLKKIKWENSKRLMYGTLLCLTPDEFKTLYFATVHEIDRDSILKRGTFKLRIEYGENINLPIGHFFTMLESTVYFEPYRHVLHCLQCIRSGDLPFEQTIVHCSEEVAEPMYLRGKYPVYDLRPIIHGDCISLESDRYMFGRWRRYRSEGRRTENVNILSDAWPKADELHLDQSQYEAFKSAITEEFVLIQGPPGTGKTHIGLQIAKTLLHNRENWGYSSSNDHLFEEEEREKSPMLVVCYTNHALDQFLEGIIKFSNLNHHLTSGGLLIRAGGQSKNETVKDFSLTNERRKHRLDRCDSSIYLAQLKQNQRQIAYLKWSIKQSRCLVLHEATLCSLVPYLRAPMENLKDKDGNYIMTTWLGVDGDNWIKSATKAYNSGVCSTLPRKEYEGDGNKNVNNTEPRDQNPLIDVATEEEQAIQDRRIEEEEMENDYTFNEDIGLDIDSQLYEVLDWSDFDETMKMLIMEEAEKAKHKLLSAQPMNEEEVAKIGNCLWDLSRHDRWRLYSLWSKQCREQLQRKLALEEKNFPTIFENYREEQQRLDKSIFKRAAVIGMTTTSAARYQNTLREVGPKIVIVEEAAEVLEAHILASLSPKCEHLILIGDHKQLEPKTAVYELATKYNLALSMFERMINNKVKFHCLQRQHRMRPEISQLVRHIYPKLEDNENVFKYDDIKGIKTNVFFLNHNTNEDYKDEGKSYSNEHEAFFAMRLCRYLLQQGYSPKQITVLTPYSGQLFCLRNIMPRDKFDGVQISILDNYQGEENDIILLSLVRSNEEMNIGFLSKENRVCVALSRAKKGFFVIGNFDLMISHPRGSKIWKPVFTKITESMMGNALRLYCQNHPHKETLVTSEGDFSENPEGGCKERCDFRLLCGHACALYCHPYDQEHKLYKCRKECHKRCERDHMCNRDCHFPDPCKCETLVEHTLSRCGHSVKIHCFINPEQYQCEILVERNLPCGHVAKLACHKDVSIYVLLEGCNVMVTKTLPLCGHAAELLCRQNPRDVKCKTTVEKKFECGHPSIEIECYRSSEVKCAEECAKTCEQGHSCEKMCHHPSKCDCQVKVVKPLVNCGHPKEMVCSADPKDESHICSMKVNKKLLCGHEKLMDCSEPTDSVLCSVTWSDRALMRQLLASPFGKAQCREMTTKTLPVCGHTANCFCFQDPKSVKCKTIIEKKFSCHHPTVSISCNRSSLARCTEICNKTCERGHSCREPCHYPTSCNCRVVVDKVLPCGHHKDMECHQDPQDESIKCSEKVKKTIPCGHEKLLKCSSAVKHVLCSVNLHTLGVILKRHQRLKVHPSRCKEIIQKELSCGHKVDAECSMSPSEIKCEENVAVKLKCGHMKTVKCFSKKSETFLQTCEEVVEKSLPCGHLIMTECHKSVKYQECTTTVTKICPNCQYEHGIKCCDTHKPFICKEMVKKVMPTCGHEQELQCCKDPRQSLCVKNIEVTHPECSHKISIPCNDKKKFLAQQNRKKNTKVNFSLPLCQTLVDVVMFCGKETQVECWRARNVQCSPKVNCHKSLQCGHTCQGSCVKCKYGMLHVGCKMECNKILFCGHKCRSNKCGSCGICHEICDFKCSHRQCKHSCSEVCPPCKKACAWNCPHFKCKTLCHQLCDRPRCNKRCKKKLQCGHQCMGFCGDPCPSICGLCHSEIINSVTNKDVGTVIVVQLVECGHIFESEFLDDHMETSALHCTDFKRCPDCQVIIKTHPRYNNILKQQYQNVNYIRQAMTTMAKKRVCFRFPIFAESILECKTNFEQCKMFLRRIHLNDLREDQYMYHYAGFLLEDTLAFVNMILKSRDPTAQNYIDVYHSARKICAIWMLFHHIVNTDQTTDISEEKEDQMGRTQTGKVSEEDISEEKENQMGRTGDSESSRNTHDASHERETTSSLSNVIKDVCNLIKRPDVFTREDLDKVEQLIVDASQNRHPLSVNRMTTAKAYPMLPVSVDVHKESWKKCDKGHIFCSLCEDCGICWICNGYNPCLDLVQSAVSDQMPGRQDRSWKHNGRNIQRRNTGDAEIRDNSPKKHMAFQRKSEQSSSTLKSDKGHTKTGRDQRWNRTLFAGRVENEGKTQVSDERKLKQKNQAESGGGNSEKRKGPASKMGPLSTQSVQKGEGKYHFDSRKMEQKQIRLKNGEENGQKYKGTNPVRENIFKSTRVERGGEKQAQANWKTKKIEKSESSRSKETSDDFGLDTTHTKASGTVNNPLPAKERQGRSTEMSGDGSLTQQERYRQQGARPKDQSSLQRNQQSENTRRQGQRRRRGRRHAPPTTDS